MACVKVYYGNDGKPSVLYEQLTNQYGETEGERRYLKAMSLDLKSSQLNEQGEPSEETLANLDLSTIRFKKSSSTDIYSNMTTSGKNVDFRPEEHEYFVGDRKLRSTSEVTNKYVPYTGLKTEFNYAEEGQRYHSVVESIIKRLELGKESEEEVKAAIRNEFGLQPFEDNFLSHMTSFIRGLQRTGRVVAEYRAALVDKGIAGTLDIVHVKNNGKVDIYDLKTAYDTPGRRARGSQPWNVYDRSGRIPNYKAQRYALQLSFYRYIMEHGDAVTGRNGVDVDNVYVLPITIMASNEDITDFSGVSVGSPENIYDWQKGTANFAEIAAKRVRAELETESVKESGLKGLAGSSTISSFVDTVAPGAELSESEMHRRASTIATSPRNPNGFRYNGVNYQWKQSSKEGRIAQVKAVMAQGFKTANEELVRTAISTAEETPIGIFSDNPTAANQLRQLLDFAPYKRVYALSSIKGFENYSDILVIERETGTLDFVKMTFEDLSRKFKVRHATKLVLSERVNDVGGSIVGNYMSWHQSKSRGITLQNTLFDREKLRMALIAMQLKEANPDMNVERLMINSFAAKNMTIPEPVVLAEVLPQIRAMRDSEELKKFIVGNLEQTLQNDKLYDVRDYMPDFAAEYLNFISTNVKDRPLISPKSGERNARFYIANAIQKYSNDELTKNELLERLVGNEGGIRRLIATNYSGTAEQIQQAVLRDPEYMRYAQTALTLYGHIMFPESDVINQFIGKTMSYVVTPTKTGRQTLDRAFDEARRYIDRAKRDLAAFNQEKVDKFQKLVSADPAFKMGANIKGKNFSPSSVLGYGQIVYERLIQKRVDSKGRDYMVPYLIEEGSKEFNQLSPTQQKTIVWINDSLQRLFRESHPQKDATGKYIYNWPRGAIPVIGGRPNTHLFKAKQGIVKGEKSTVKTALVNYAKQVWAFGSREQSFRPPDKTNAKEHIYDYFLRQVDTMSGDLQFATLDSIGLDENLQLVDRDLNETFETDLDTVITEFAHHNIKKAHLDKALPVMNMFKSIFNYYDMAYFLNQRRSVEMLDNFVNDNMFSEKIAGDSLVAKVTSFGIGVSAKMMLALNWKVFTQNFFQMKLNAVVHGLAAQMEGDQRAPHMKEWLKGFNEIRKAAMPGNDDKARLIELITAAYMTEDLAIQRSKKYKPAQHGLLDEQSAMAFDRMMEHGMRSLYLVAQMIKDGTYDAHSVRSRVDEYGDTVYYLHYDESKDERFKKDPELRDAIKADVREGEPDIGPDGQLMLAYNWRLRQKYKSYADEIFATMDKDLKSDMGHFGIFSSITFMRSWFRDTFIRTVKREYPNHVVGDYVRIDGEDGKSFVWSDIPYKGVMWTMLDGLHLAQTMAKEGGFGALRPADRKNMILLGNSIGSWGLLATFIMLAFKDKDDPEAIMLKTVLLRGIQDLNSFVTFGPLPGIANDPFIFASYYERLFHHVGRAFHYGMEGEFKLSAKQIADQLPLVREFI